MLLALEENNKIFSFFTFKLEPAMLIAGLIKKLIN